ncbi:non-ribosomal peptide synthase/polyketide synthase [Pseudomonas sp. CIP-10]|uniref:non-ribosomal peptide synthase/polyketide synthase n=2 Tax=unclassified Pseudomonas TaxID=196821 RepID=UPI001E45E220|nr:non-ribosomal peptide synthase/polyketide synthase [Pseudomonas sp. CIP-10]UFH28619.1 non-ribosomal peptide synthase/polyketide synthase [Pseudomonas sp. CIP-10]
MNVEKSLKLARRFIELPVEKRRLFLETLASEGIDFSQFPIPADVAVDDRHALSYAQQRMWFLWQLDPHGAAYNLPSAVVLKGALDTSAVQRAFEQVLQRHQALRTVFQTQGDDVVQVVQPAAIVIEEHDLQALAAEARDAAVAQAVRDEAGLPFDLQQGPLFRVRLLKLAAQEHVLLLTLHHIVADGWSMNVLIQEFVHGYDALVRGQVPVLPELPIQYSDYALWQRRWLEAGEQARQLAYWQAKLGDQHPVLQLPADYPRPLHASRQGQRLPIAVPQGLSERLAGLVRQQGVTLFSVLLAGFKLLLQHYSGLQDIRVGVPVANRNREEVEGLIGVFVNTQVLRTELDPQMSVAQLLADIRETTRAAQSHQDLPFERLVEGLQVERSLSHTPLFQVLHNHQANVADIGALRSESGLELHVLERHERSVQFELTLDTVERDGQVQAAFTYARELFAPATIERMASHWLNLLQAMAADPLAAIGDLPLLGAGERQRLLQASQPAASEFAVDNILALFAAQVAQQPQAPALVFGDRQLSYAELDADANRLAHQLIEWGVGPEVRVGIAVERSVEMIVGLLAILKAGGAYVPFDPEYPQERLAYMLDDSGVQLLLTQQALLPRLPQDTQVRYLVLDQAAEELARFSTTAPPAQLNADNLAYVIYTSGSTGRSKGVTISHGALANYVQAALQRLALGRVASMAVVSTLAADLGHTTLFGALCSGSCLHVIALDISLDAERFAAYMHAHAVDVLKIVPSHLQALLDGPHPARALPQRALVLGGEACPAGLMAQLAQLAPHCTLFNHYGPTETTVGALADAVEAPPATGRAPLGRPLANMQAYVLDASLQPLSTGCQGELYLAGAGVARGYHRRAAMTAERFVPNPFGAAGSRVYRTGDLARQLANGQVDYLGRVDHQVKIRGYRIELGEITDTLKRQPRVHDAVAVIHGTGSAARILAYVVPDSQADAPQVLADVQAALARQLPDYMLPSRFMALPGMPLTLNGKLDLRALPVPDEGPAQAYRAPQTTLQQQLALIWQDVLNVAQVGLDDNFFALGGHSLLATQIIARVRRILGRDVPLRSLFESNSLQGFAEQVLGAGAQHVEPIAAVPRDQPLVASHAQQRQWLFWQMQPHSTAYHTPMVVRLRGELDRAALTQAFAILCERHEAFRTTFVERDGVLLQRIQPAGELPLTWDRLPATAELAQIQAQVLAETQRLFDLGTGPLWRAKVLQLGEQDQLLVVTLHHIISDGGSMSVMVREFVALYQALHRGEAPALAKLPIQYADYAAWHKHWLDQGELQRQLDYWRGQLGSEQPILELPIDHPRSALKDHRLGRVAFALDSELAQRLRQLAREHELTLFQLFLGAFALLLQRYCEQPDVRIGIPVSNRSRQELENVLGFFVNTLVMRVEVDPAMSGAALLSQVKATALAGQAHQDLPFDRLVEALNPQRSLDRNPLFQVMYNHLSIAGQQVGSTSLAGLHAEEMTLQGGTAQFDLTLETLETDAAINVSFLYAAELFEAATLQRMAEHWCNLLRGLAADPAQAVGELPLLAPQEQAALLQGWQQAGLAAAPAAVHQLIAEQARRQPQAVALLIGDQQLSYGQLEARANQLAHRLRALGVGPDVLVGIALERSLDMVVGLLGILKAGGAFLPLDPQYPAERLAYMMQDSGIDLLLSHSRVLPGLDVQAGMRTLLLDQRVEQPGADHAPTVALSPQNLAYVIYTSGSTGQPKGVAVAHGPLAMHCLATGQWYEMTPADRELHFLSFAFDGAHERWLTSLVMGGSLLLRDDELWSPERTYEEIRRHGVTMAGFPPAYLQQLAEHAAHAGNPPPVRLYSFGGDAMPRATYERVQQSLQPQVMINGYGPTETVVTPMVWRTRAGDHCDSAYAPIGQPVGERSACVLDAALGLLPAGVAGQLYLGGAGLARGYLGRPGLTADRFVPDPFGTEGARLYRTGDQVRLRADGQFDYLGRIDNQVKIRGFRVELGEIEACLLACAEVREAVVVAVDGPSGKQLAAYLVLADSIAAHGPAEQREQLKAALRQSLPDYMLPTHWLVLEQLPLLPNGKLDRKALPAPDFSALQQAYVAPRNALEQRLAALWQRVLKLPQVGVSDNFFELGGDSIISIQLVSRARQDGLLFSARDLFEHQTVAALASVAQVGACEVQADQGPLSGEQVLLPVHQLFFAQEIPARHHWNQSILLEPRQPLNAADLDQALHALVEHHDALRLSFAPADDGWQARYRSPAQCAQAALLWQAAADDEGGLHTLLEQAQRSLDLENGPLLRALLATLADGSQRLLLVVHHLVVDGVSWRILLEDLQQAYAAVLAGNQPNLPAKSHSMQAWAKRLQGHAAHMQGQLGYWCEQLQGRAALPRRQVSDLAAANQQCHAHTVYSRLDRAWTERLLREAPAAYRTRVNDLLLAALVRVIAGWTGRDEVSVLLEGHGREALFDDLDLSRTLGWFTTVFPLKLAVPSERSHTLKQVKQHLHSIPDNGIGFGVLGQWGSAEARQQLGHAPLPEITFNYLGQFDGSFDQAEALFVPAKEDKGADHDAQAPLGNLLSLNGQVYGGELSLGWTFSRELFDSATLERLAADYTRELQALIEHCCTPGVCGVTPSDFPLARLSQAQLDQLPVPAAEIADLYPLAPMQQGMLFHALYEQQAGDYVNQMRVDVDGLDVERFRRAWEAVLQRHDILRTQFHWEHEQALQVVRKHVELPFVVHDWQGREGLEAALEQLALDQRQQGFDLSQAPLLRLALVRTGPARQHLLYTSHHILMDGWSNSQLLGEVLHQYALLGDGQPSALPPVTSRYSDYIGWLGRQDAAAGEAFWKDCLRDLQGPTRLAQAIAYEAQAEAGQGYAEHVQVIDAATTGQLVALARQHKVTLNTLLQGAWLLLLQRYTGQDSVTFGATVAGRPAALKGIEQQVGLFINTLPVTASPAPQLPFAQFLQQLQAQNVAMREFEHTPLFDIQRWSGQGGETLFDNILVFENYPVSEALQQGAPAGLSFGEVYSREQTHYPLTLSISQGQTLQLHYSHALEHLQRPALAALADNFQHVLQQCLSLPLDSCLGAFCLVAPATREGLLQHVNQTAAEYPLQHSYAELFEAQVARTPQAVVARCGDRQYSYSELNRRANRVAHGLIALGVGPDQPVALLAQRSLELLGMMVGTFKAAAGYLPLDPGLPQQRLSHIVALSRTPVLLCTEACQAQAEALLDALDEARRPQLLVLETLDRPGSAEHDPQRYSGPQHLAYVIYTSGSTGQPKGVMVEQAGMLNNQLSKVPYLGLGPDDVIAQTASQSFDISVWQFLAAPLFGGCVQIVPNELAHDPEALLQHVREQRISVLESVPSLIQGMFQAPAIAVPSLRWMLPTGEALAPELARQWLQRYPDVGLVNAYGPAECSDDVAFFRVDLASTQGVYLPIGSPTDNNRLYVLDAALELAPLGVTGELCVAGTGVGRGYVGDPLRTAQAFIPHPCGAPGERLYRTGDLARRRADGVLEYVGRVDHQVKIRGFRIELGEIEAALLDSDQVREAVVMAQPGANGPQLVAYCVADDAVAADALKQQLKASLKARLPDYMVPVHWVLMARLPLTPNGKVDRKALPLPDMSQARQAYVAPRSELEQQLAAIWQDVLKLEQVGLDDNFFELGGDSIVSIQVVGRARQAGIAFSPKDVFEQQTVQGLARVARRGAAQQQIDQGPVSGELHLLPAQAEFFALAIPERHHWNQSVLLDALQPLDADRLEHALHQLVVHHDGLRLKFDESEQGWRASFGEAHVRHALLWQRDCADAQALEALCDQAQASLCLGSGDLVRAVLVTQPGECQRLLLVIHHLLVDGVSWRILLEDLQRAYRQCVAGQTVVLPAKTSSLRDWAGQLQAYAGSEGLGSELAYWQAQLQHDHAELPCDHPGAGQQRRRARTVSTQLDREVTRQLLQEAPATYRTQVNDLLLTALARVVGRWSGQAATLIQLEGHGREELSADLDLSRTVGWFTSLYPVCLRVEGELGASIKQVKEQLRAIPNKGLGYGVLRYLGSDEQRQALLGLATPRITFNYLGQFDASFDGAGDALLQPSRLGVGAEQSADAPLENWLSLNGQVYGGELRMGWTFSLDLFDEQTVQRLADDYGRELRSLVEHCLQANEAGEQGMTPSDFPLAGLSQAQLDALPVPAAQVEDIYALSPMQQGMLFHSLYEQGSGDYINQMRADVQGLDAERLRAAWQAVYDRHEVLRASVLWQGQQQPLQVIHKHLAVALVYQDWRERRELPTALDQLANAERLRGFDLGKAPLQRIQVIRIGDDRYHLIDTNHHILMDGWSYSQLLGEVLEQYGAQARGEPRPAAPAGRYRDYIGWLQRQDAQASEQFWKARLADLEQPTLLSRSLATGQPLAEADVAGQGQVVLLRDRQQTRQLSDFARQHKVTLNTLMQGAWLLLLQRYTGQAAVAFGVTVAGRPAELRGVEAHIGLFINTLPVVASPRPEQPVVQWLQALQSLNLQLREHEHTPLFEIQRWAGHGGEGLFDSIMVFENYPVSEILQQTAPEGLRFDAVHNHEQANYPLTLAVNQGETLSVTFGYDRGCFAAVQVEQLAGHLRQLLEQIVEASAHQALGSLTLLDAQQQQATFAQWNPAPAEHPANQALHSRIEAQVQRTPDAIAVTCEGQALSYAQLNQRANALARRLVDDGVGPDVLVGLAAERSLDMVVGIFAILKAGGAYVPLDPAYPADRLAYMIEDSGLQRVLAQPQVLASLPVPAGVRVLSLASNDDSTQADPLACSPVTVSPDNLAYVIYTSGSTGKPKGVLLPQRNVLRLFTATGADFRFGSDDVWSLFHSYAFDFSVWEIFGALLYGGRLVIVPQHTSRSPEAFYQLLADEQVTVLNQTPSAFKQLMAVATTAEPQRPLALRSVVFGGEALDVNSLAPWFERFGDRQPQLVNMYGITETTVHVSYRPLSRADLGKAASSPMGVPIPDLSWYVLDGDLNPVAKGCIGELYVGRAGLARGYLKRSDLSATRFVPDPFGAPGGRLYRTGDLARYHADGVIEYVGRIDHQVKIRGFRIELGEIEARLQAQPQVREALVLAQEGATGQQLVAYLIPAAEVALEQQAGLRAQLREQLKEALPDYMVPAHLLLLDRWPLTANGKLDRKALPKADASLLQQGYRAPGSELEQQLAAIWQDVLKLEQVGLDDHFFELGGHSLLAVSVVSRVQLELGLSLTPQLIFQHPTLASFAEQLAQASAPADTQTLSKLSALLDEMEEV